MPGSTDDLKCTESIDDLGSDLQCTESIDDLGSDLLNEPHEQEFTIFNQASEEIEDIIVTLKSMSDFLQMATTIPAFTYWIANSIYEASMFKFTEKFAPIMQESNIPEYYKKEYDANSQKKFFEDAIHLMIEGDESYMLNFLDINPKLADFLTKNLDQLKDISAAWDKRKNQIYTDGVPGNVNTDILSKSADDIITALEQNKIDEDPERNKRKHEEATRNSFFSAEPGELSKRAKTDKNASDENTTPLKLTY